MDEVDVAICRLLLYNSRMSYSEMGKALGISVQSAHKRVQALIDSGVIGGFRATFTERAYRSVWVMVYGRSSAPTTESVLRELNKEKATDLAMVASGKYLYITGVVLDPSKINRFVSTVTKTAQLIEPQVGIVHFPPLAGFEEEPAIYPMDVKIVDSLRNDARKPVTALAKELGVAPRTIVRHLDRLNKEMLVHFAFEWHPQRSADVFATLHLTVRKNEDREKVAVTLIKRLGMREIITYGFSDRPDFLICLFWSPSIQAVNELVNELEADGMFSNIEPHILMDVRYYGGYTETPPPVRTASSK